MSSHASSVPEAPAAPDASSTPTSPAASHASNAPDEQPGPEAPVASHTSSTANVSTSSPEVSATSRVSTAPHESAAHDAQPTLDVPAASHASSTPDVPAASPDPSAASQIPGTSHASTSSYVPAAAHLPTTQDDLALNRVVNDLAERQQNTHLYPGTDYANLAQFLNTITSHDDIEGPDSQTSIVVHPVGESDSEAAGANQAKSFSCQSIARDPPALREALAAERTQLVFVQGFPHPRHISLVFEHTKVNPELFRRHWSSLAGSILAAQATDFLTDDPTKIFPPLPSEAVQTFTLSVPTIIQNDGVAKATSPRDYQSRRKEASENLRTYHSKLAKDAMAGDSLIRGYRIVSDQISIIEQSMSVAIVKGSGGWQAVILMDQARDLDECAVPGPWVLDSARPLMARLVPIFQHRTDPSDESSSSTQESSQGPSSLAQGAPGPASSARSSTLRAHQNSTLLPNQLGRGLDKALMRDDALYALSDLFHLSAAAENQVLYGIQVEVENELRIARGEKLNPAATTNLAHLKLIVDEHLKSLTETATILANWDVLGWPSAGENATVKDKARLLLENFVHLKGCAGKISSDCQEAINSLTAEATRREGAKNALFTCCLALSTFVFTPFILVTAVFGMNFSEMENLALWVLAPAIAGAILFSVLVIVLWLRAGHIPWKRVLSYAIEVLQRCENCLLACGQGIVRVWRQLVQRARGNRERMIPDEIWFPLRNIFTFSWVPAEVLPC